MTATKRHFKGGLYRVLMDNAWSSTDPPIRQVVYQSLNSGEIWTRPYSEFHAKVQVEVPRFTDVEPAADEAGPERKQLRAAFRALVGRTLHFCRDHSRTPVWLTVGGIRWLSKNYDRGVGQLDAEAYTALKESIIDEVVADLLNAAPSDSEA